MASGSRPRRFHHGDVHAQPLVDEVLDIQAVFTSESVQTLSDVGLKVHRELVGGVRPLESVSFAVDEVVLRLHGGSPDGGLRALCFIRGIMLRA